MTADRTARNGVSRPFQPKRIFLIGAAAAIFFTPHPVNGIENARAQTNPPPVGQAGSQNRAEGKKTGGIVGDPSHKRGLDLGYDAGPRAGREDKADNKDRNPAARQEYKNPGQFYRYEYGSRALFIAGFRRGFLRGYNSSFKKTELKPSKSKPESASVALPQDRKLRMENIRRRDPSHTKITLAEDAL